MKVLIVILLLITSTITFSQNIEELGYNIRFGFIRGGKATLTARDTVYGDNPAIHYHLEGWTVGLPNALFPVHDIYESIVNKESKLPYLAIRNIREQKYRYYNEAFFFHDKDSIYSERSGAQEMEPNTVDFATVFFYLRQNNLIENMETGDTLELPLFHADESFKMSIKYLGVEQINSAFGKVNCHVLSPRVKMGKLLKSSDGLKFYFSKDANRLPLLLEFDLRVGALRCSLNSYKKKGMEMVPQKSGH